MQTPTYGESCSERSEALLGFDDEFVYAAGRLYDREPDRIQITDQETRRHGGHVGLVRRPFRFVQRQGELPGLFHDTGGAALRRRRVSGRADRHRDGYAHEPELEHVLGRGRRPLRGGLVRRDAHPALEPPLPGGSRRRGHGRDRLPLALPPERDRRLPGHPEELGRHERLEALAGPGDRLARPAAAPPGLPHPLRPHRLRTDLRAQRRRDGLCRRPRPQARAGPRLQVRPDRQPDLRRDGQSRFRPGRGRRRPGQPDPLFAVLPGEAALLPGAVEQLRLQHGRLEHALLQPPHRSVGDVDSDDVEPVRIYGGARLVGRLGAWDVGFLDMQTAALDDNPSENFGVLRLRRQVINPYSYFGGMLTSRVGCRRELRRRLRPRLDLAHGRRRLFHPAVGPDIQGRADEPGLRPRVGARRRDVGKTDHQGLRDDGALLADRRHVRSGHGLRDDGRLYGLSTPGPCTAGSRTRTRR